MHKTIFDTPLINTLMRWFSLAMLRLLGWKTEGIRPADPKYVLIAAPHTSNWDFPYTLMLCFALRLRVYWVGKASLFRWPLGPLARWLGGIAVDRSATKNMVQTTIEAFARQPRLVVIVAPEGTRGRVSHWKTGFYHIAHGAGVPVALAYLDFKRKTGGIGQMFHTSGDIERDMEQIQLFYRGVTGKNQEQFDAARICTKRGPD
ncbi:lysophospholipid acyltransferase family protein [Janthinobacterium sp.]|uniref:lysophospholipid acyltransferase family protein n=1 Tax=Janthinobacterium sp. TaxID=1871054 RepID=UPI00293D48D4|nr:lysophospholipid acyltransferase family protein [Janthinobacterium sp.]